jgi:hypothetical protein
MMATEPRIPAAAISLPSRDNATAMIGASGEHVDLPVGTGGDDLAVGRNGNRVERRRQRCNDRSAATGKRRDAQRRVVTRGNEPAAVGCECNAVDALCMALNQPRRAAGERP